MYKLRQCMHKAASLASQYGNIIPVLLELAFIFKACR